MGYQAEKGKVDKRIKIIKICALFFAVVILGGLCIFSFWCPAETWKYGFALPETGTREVHEMRVHFLDVGQGDCEIVELPDGKILLIDGGGDEGCETEIMRYLNALRIDTIDYLVLTHADADHCNGLLPVVEYKKVKRVFLPLADASKNEAYAALYAEIIKKGCSWEYAARSINLSVEGEISYTLRFLYPYTLQTETGVSDNEASAVIWLDYLGASVLFAGDAPISTEEKLIRDDKLGILPKRVALRDTELLKVAHHGSSNSTSEAFLRYLGVKQAVISCGKNNPYAFPTKQVLSALSAQGVEVYRTDESGHLVWTVLPTGDYVFEALGKE